MLLEDTLELMLEGGNELEIALDWVEEYGMPTVAKRIRQYGTGSIMLFWYNALSGKENLEYRPFGSARTEADRQFIQCCQEVKEFLNTFQ